MATAGGEEDVFLDRTSRSTRGKRMTKLLDEEVEDDEQFWNQDALKEEENDDSYEEEAEAVDEYDSDFDDDEPEPDEEVEDEGNERVKTKKKLTFPGKQATKKKSERKAIPKVERLPRDENSLQAEKTDEPAQQEITDGAQGDRIVRKSTRTSVIVRQAERDAIRAALQATMKPIKRKKEGEEKKMTQEEMLLEAAQTEIRNLRNLERVLAREEEVKKKAVVHKEVYTGPQIRYVSRDDKTFLEFSKGLSFQSEICTTAAPYPEKAVCAVTGLPAKYRDPKTGLPYTTLDAFKTIRERSRRGRGGGEGGAGGEENEEQGPLFALVNGRGFSGKSRRSGPRKVLTSSRAGPPRRRVAAAILPED
ncbi:unnamed protein product [Spirodela intermedia]|uniref:Vps72/YL1 C-terminal domain-containing protein n=1 Tax=Spirodela intermedia TaxID=51605 RepID=A0A7I8L3M9_SPIIN|nr:unnamed protein product [Spirodela intermedia]